MNRASFRAMQSRTSAGVTLIELMIAMVLGLLVTAGIITVFFSTSRSNLVQAQMARLQENGRFAVGQISQSLRLTGAPYCSGSGGGAKIQDGGSVFTDTLRSPTVVTATLALPDNTTDFGTGNYPTAPSSVYALPSYAYMRGYDCDKDGDCLPIDPHDIVADIPAAGTSVGDRVVGTDVLTIRHLVSSEGWTIGADDTVTQDTDRTVKTITIKPDAGEPAPNTVASGDLFMYGDCSNTYIFSGTATAGTDLVVAVDDVGAGNMQKFLANLSADTQTKLFDFSNAFKTETWYLQVVDDGSATGRATGALMRRVNGNPAEEIVRGVERLDFRYGVADSVGNMRYLTADDIDKGVVSCPMQPPKVPLSGTGVDAGCLWRAVQTIEVSMLVDGQQSLNSLEDSALAYAYSLDSASPAEPDDASHAVKYSDQGFERGLLRREFNALVSVRNYNP